MRYFKLFSGGMAAERPRRGRKQLQAGVTRKTVPVQARSASGMNAAGLNSKGTADMFNCRMLRNLTPKEKELTKK